MGERIEPRAVCDGGDLDCGSGLLLIIRNAMEPLAGGDVLEVRSRETSVREDLPAWCRMVGHDLLETAPGTDRYTHYFVRKKAGGDRELEEHLEKARDYRWRVRARWKEGMRARVFARGHSFAVGQPASFDTDDASPSAVEYLLAALAGCLAVGFQWRASRRGVAVRDLEVALRARLDNVLVFLGVEETGHPGLAGVEGRLFVDADGDDETLRALFDETVAKSPVAQSLVRRVGLDVQIRRA